MARIKTNDKVIVIAGKDKGKTGSVLKLAKNSTRVYVEGVNKVSKHVKPNPQQGQQGGIVEQERSVHISNVAIFNEQASKADRIKYKLDDNGQKVRIFASSGEVIDL